MRVKRMQDKERMKDFEKTKLQVEQLLEFKAKVMESQVSDLKKSGSLKYQKLVPILLPMCIARVIKGESPARTPTSPARSPRRSLG